MDTRLGVGLTILLAISWGLFMLPSIIAIPTVFSLDFVSQPSCLCVYRRPFLETGNKERSYFKHGWRICRKFLLASFCAKKEASAIGLCKALTRKVTLLGYPWVVVDPNLIALPISILLIIFTCLSSFTFHLQAWCFSHSDFHILSLMG